MILFTARHFHRDTLRALKDAGVDFELKDRVVSRLHIMSLCYDEWCYELRYVDPSDHVL